MMIEVMVIYLHLQVNVVELYQNEEALQVQQVV
jgi:hypothetical protein